MADRLTLGTSLVNVIVSRVEDVKRNHEECKLLGSLAQKTLSVLEALEAKALSDPTATATIECVYKALNEADKAIESCCTTNVIYASLYSEDYSYRLKHAAAKLENSIAQTCFASVGMTAEIQSELASLSNQIQYARVEERAKTAEQTQALKDAFERAFDEHGQESREVTSIIKELIQQQTLSVDELRNELLVLKQKACEARSNKEKQREFELNQIIAVVSESLGDVHEVPRVLQTLKECLCCPISKDIMRDPVILKDSNMTYDRSSITEWLRLGRHYDPLTNIELVSRDLVPNYALRGACQILLAQSESPNVVDNFRTEDAKHQVELGLYEGHGTVPISETIIHASQLLVFGPNGVVVGCTLYSEEDLGTQRNTLDSVSGRWDVGTNEVCFEDNRFNYRGNVEIKTNVRKETIEWRGKVSEVEALNHEYDLNLNYAPPPIKHEFQVHPTIIEMKGEIDATKANVKYISKVLLALKRDRSIDGWMSFESMCRKHSNVGHILSGRWDETGILQFFIYFSSSNTPLHSDSKPISYVACFSVIGAMTQSERLLCPSFSAILSKAQGQDELGQDTTTTTPLDGLELIEYSLIREASAPWCYLHPNPLKLFQLLRGTLNLNATLSLCVHFGCELECSEYIAKINLDARYALIPHSQHVFRRSLLHIAAENNYVQFVKELITKGVDVNSRDYNGQTPLHLALSTNSIDAVKELLSKNAVINVQDNFGKTPLDIALEKRNFDVIRKVIGNTANIDSQDDNELTLLHQATKNNDISVVKELIANGANVNLQTKDGCTPLYIAFEENSIDTIKELIANDANINLQTNVGLTPLYIASAKNCLDAIKELIANGANIDHPRDNGCTPLCAASGMNFPNAIKELIANGANVNHQIEYGCTPLYIASERNSIDAIKELIANGANIELQAKDGSTPLYIASKKNSIDVVKELIANGANVNLQTKDGCTPLYIASEENSIDAIKELIANGANVNHQSDKGCTPLYVASGMNSIDAVKELVANGANIDLQTIYGWTPLHVASACGRVSVVKILLDHGASKVIRTKRGMTSYNVACCCSSFGPFEDVTINELKELLKTRFSLSVVFVSLYNCLALFKCDKRSRMH